MMEGITKDTLKTTSPDSNALEAAATTVSKTSTSGKKVKPEKREKRPYHYRTKKPRDMPKRPLSAYNYFFRTERGKFVAEQAEKKAAEFDTPAPDAVQAEEEQGGEKVKSSLFSTMGKTIAKRWKEIVPEELEEYKALAAEDSIRYRAEMDEYHAGRARKAPQKKETKDSPVSKEAGLSASQPAAPSFLEGMISGLSSSVPSHGGTSAPQLQQLQTSLSRDPYLDQLIRLQQAQQGSAPQQQLLYGSPTMGSINAGGGVDMSALQSQILDAQLSRAMQQQQQQQQQRATLGLDIYSAGGGGGQYATAMTSQGPYGGGAHTQNHQAMIDGALFQRVSQGMQAPGQTAALDGALFQRASHGMQPPAQTAASQRQGGFTQGGGGEYDSHFQASGGGSEQQQQLLLQQLMQQQFAAAQPQQQQYSTLPARDPQASSGDMARRMLQQQQMASQQGAYSSALNDVEDRDASGGGDNSAGERW
jgi:hypothetical protein